MITRISSVQAQPNRIQAQDKQVKPAFGTAKMAFLSQVTENHLLINLNERQEHKEILSLIRKIGENKLKFVESLDDGARDVFKDKKGNTIELEKAGKTYKHDSVVVKSQNNECTTTITRDEDTNEFVGQAFGSLGRYLQDIAESAKQALIKKEG